MTDQKTKLTTFSKILIAAAILVALFFLITKTPLRNYIIPDENSNNEANNNKDNEKDKDKKVKTIKIGVVTWGGYAGGQYFNEGFKANEKSRFFKEYGFKVEFKVLDDFNDSRNAWKAGKVDLLWATIDAFTTEVQGLKDYNPQVIFQADWSRGGDAIVVRRGIENVSDLKGKKVAFAEMTPSHTFLLWLLDAGGLKYSDIKKVKVANAIDAADLFKKGAVDAAVVWSPDDADCVAKVTGSKILQNTKDASHIIADVFVCKKKYLDENFDDLKNLAKGWFIGASEINGSDNAKNKAAKILAKGLRQPKDFCLQAIKNVRLCTYGDNVNFYNLTGKYTGVTGESIYNLMEKKYKKAKYIKNNLPSWRYVGNSSLIGEIKLEGEAHSAEKRTKFKKITKKEEKEEKAIATKRVSIQFRTGSFELDGNMKRIIDLEFMEIAKSFAKARIRIEGNTDNVGDRKSNITLSQKRAKAVASYMAKEYGFDKNRFIIVGNGPDKPISNNKTASGRSQNRRTDFELLGKK